MITRDQALSADVFHFERPGNPNGCERWRRNGQTKTWKTRPDAFRVPVKHGLYAYGAITEADLDLPRMHVESECELA